MPTAPRLILVHSEARSYRIPVFNYLHRKYQINFLLSFWGRGLEKNTRKPSWSFTYFRNYKLPFYSTGVTPGIAWHLIHQRGSSDLVIFTGLHAFNTHFCLPIALILGFKVILWDETWVLPKTMLSKFITPYLRWLVRRCDANIAAGTKAKELYIKLGADPKKVFIAPNSTPDISTEIDHQLTQRLKEKWQIPAKTQVISYMGRVVAYKNLDCLIKAFVQIRPHFPQAILFIAGDGPYASYCQELIDKLGSERIIWAKEGGNTVEPIDHHEFIHFYDFTDIFVLPGRFVDNDIIPCEAWGLTLNEAMSLGKPVIASRSAAATFDLIEDGKNGIVVDPDNTKSMAEAITKMLSQFDLKLAGQRSKAIIENGFSSDQTGQGFDQAIKYAISANQNVSV